jgi:transcriptional regulator with XRE-family HTH domain
MKNSSADRADFAHWLTRELTKRGYDITGARSGGRSRFAQDSGLSPSTVGRLLRGEGATDTRTLATLAEALRVPLGDVLVRAGVLDANELAAVRHPTRTDHITPQQAAHELGITDEQAVRMFVSMVETLRQPPPSTPGEGNLAEH